jgi:signal transduction histidine kinase
VLTRTVDSYTLIVARSDVEVDEIAAIIEQAFWVAAACTAAVALAGGLLLGWRAQRRVERFSTALDAVAHGNLDKRVRAKGRGGDDLDRIARDLNSTLDRLHSLVTSMKHVTVDIAHDLKSPIARLRNQLADALTKVDGNAAVQGDIGEAIGEADRISATFDSLLKIAQIESGERREHFVPFDLAERVRQVVDLYVPVAEDAGDVLMLEAEPPKPLPVHGDPSLVGQLLVNLIENSIRHSPGGTRIVVSARQTKQGAALSVADNGPGIAESEYDNVLKRFYRLDKSRGTRGSGLGLALVAAVTEVHDAELHLSSASPGLKVTVLFPSPTVLRPGATAAKKPGAQGWTATGAIAPR